MLGEERLAACSAELREVDQAERREDDSAVRQAACSGERQGVEWAAPAMHAREAEEL